MGFYGNITNTSKTTFSFDKIYKNRQTMDLSAKTDGVFLGRYVLVEYGMTASQYIVGYLDNGLMYDDPTNRDPEHIIPWELNKIVKVYRYNHWYLYRAELSGTLQRWVQKSLFTNDRKDDAEYKANYDIDYPIYGRGYDSTVWIKQYLDNEEKYVQIAELNTVVPIFSICPLLPEDPYIKAESVVYEPNKYYYYTNGTYILDDSETQVEGRVYYNQSETPPSVLTDPTSTNLLYKLMVPTNFQLDLDDNKIYFNKEGFNPTQHHYDNSTEDVIKYTLSSSKYNNYYDVTQDSVTGEPLEEGNDRKSLVINLPSLGNAVCDTYDLLYGQNRDNSTTNFDKTNVKGALNTLNKKMNLGKLETNKLIYFSTERDSDINDNYMKSATIQGDNLISIDANIEKNSGAIKITHNDLDVSKALKSYGKNISFSTFGSSIALPKLFTDRAGHVVKEETFSVSIPKGSYKNAKEGNVLTSLSFIDTTGALTSEKSYLGTLILGEGYTTNNKLNTITKDTTLNDSISKLIDNSDNKYYTLLGQTNNNFGKDIVPTLYGLRQGINSDRDSINNLSDKIDILNGAVSTTNSVAYSIKQAIDKLDKADNKVDKQFVTAVEEKDGLITVSRSAIQERDLPITFDGTYSSSNKVATMSSLTALKTTILGSADSINTVDKAFVEIGKKIDEAGVRALTYNNTKNADSKTVSELYDIILSQATSINTMDKEINSLKNTISALETRIKALENPNPPTTE